MIYLQSHFKTMSKTMNNIKATIKRVPLLVSLKRVVWSLFNLNRTRGITKANMPELFPLYKPNSSGRYDQRAQLTIDCVNQTLPLLYNIVSPETSDTNYEIINLDKETSTEDQKNKTKKLASLFEQYGSDKAGTHNYHLLYSQIISADSEKILEIGLGTNNKNVVSNMGNTGHPGSSLRAFRDFCPKAHVYGADFDSEVLFEEDRISTFWTDQTSDVAMRDFFVQLPDGFDLIIDDGLHSPHANLRTLSFSLEKIRVGGWIIIEDISEDAVVLWNLVSKLLPIDKYSTQLYQTKSTVLFAVNRKS